MLKCAEIKIFGQVQGVFFRHQSQKKATELGLTGFVWNEPDGSVYAEAEGEEEKLLEFIKWCESGPEHARVSKVETTWREPEDKWSYFSIEP